MYEKRLRQFIIFVIFALGICALRLMQMQLLPNPEIAEQIEGFKRQRSRTIPLPTMRGRILDRKGRVLASDRAVYKLFIPYKLSSCLDLRVTNAKVLRAELAEEEAEEKVKKVRDAIQEDRDIIQQVIAKCIGLGGDYKKISEAIESANDDIWNVKIFQAWRSNCADGQLYREYRNKLDSVRFSQFIPDFEKFFPSSQERLLLVDGQEVAEEKMSFALMEFQTEQQILSANMDLSSFEGVRIEGEPVRDYPYGPVGAQMIGWVSKPIETDKKLFADDKFLSYQAGEVSGRRGVEYVCESVLRGKRGQVIYDIDGKERTTDTEMGKDVRLTIDIELQRKLEEMIINYPHAEYCGPGYSAVVIDVGTGQILAAVSLPRYDLRTIRRDYSEVLNAPSRPMDNKAFYKNYPPGSSVKPVILIAGLEEKKVTAGEVISCPSEPAPEGWPNCLQFTITKNGHDAKWSNYAKNAIKGSCNIYFSHLADRLDERHLQKWLYEFGYGHKVLNPGGKIENARFERDFRQSSGVISNGRWPRDINSFDDVPEFSSGREKRFFGIGQGSFRATPLQIANAMAVICRRGQYVEPTVLIQDNYNPVSRPLNVSSRTFDTVYAGMYAVVNENGGSGRSAFEDTDFSANDITIYGKTGSTEGSENALFAGFAKDSTGNSISFSIVVEKGQRGSSDAAPLAVEMIKLCIEEGYIGRVVEGAGDE